MMKLIKLGVGLLFLMTGSITANAASVCPLCESHCMEVYNVSQPFSCSKEATGGSIHATGNVTHVNADKVDATCICNEPAPTKGKP